MKTNMTATFTAQSRARAIQVAHETKTCQTFDAGDGWTGWACWNWKLGKVETHAEKGGVKI